MSLPGGWTADLDSRTATSHTPDEWGQIQRRALTEDEVRMMTGYYNSPEYTQGKAKAAEQAAADTDTDFGNYIPGILGATVMGMMGAGAAGLTGGAGASAGAGGAMDMGVGLEGWMNSLNASAAGSAVPWGVNPQTIGDLYGPGNSFDVGGMPEYTSPASSGLPNVPTSIPGGGGGGGGNVPVQNSTSGASFGIMDALKAVGGPIVSGLIQSGSASDASKMQSQSSADAIAESRRQYDISRGDLSPWRATGGEAVDALGAKLGLHPGAGFGDLNKKFTVGDFYDDPVSQLGLQFGLNEGTKGLNRMAGARGMLNSGANVKALTRYGNDYAGSKAADSYSRFVNDQTNVYNRLAGVAGTGQTAASTTAQLGANNATNIGNIMTSAGNARGAASIAGGNALGGIFGNIGNYYGQQQTLDKLLGGRGMQNATTYGGGFDINDPDLVYQN